MWVLDLTIGNDRGLSWQASKESCPVRLDTWPAPHHLCRGSQSRALYLLGSRGLSHICLPHSSTFFPGFWGHLPFRCVLLNLFMGCVCIEWKTCDTLPHSDSVPVLLKSHPLLGPSESVPPGLSRIALQGSQLFLAAASCFLKNVFI